MSVRRSRGAWMILPLAVALALAGCAPDPATPKRAASSTILEAAVPDDAPGCSAAVAVDGDVMWAEARGVANLETGAEWETTTPLHIASTGKQFTAMALLMLAEQGALSLEDSPADHLGGLPAWAEDLTLNDLMHHTSGIHEFFDLPLGNFGSPPYDNAAILEFVKTSDLAHLGTPGEFSYSNTNYTLLADIIAEVTGVEFSEWMQTNVFAPVDLDARFGLSLPEDPVGYEAFGSDFRVVEEWPWDVVGPGFVTTTPSELAQWGDQLREPSLVSADTLGKALSEGAVLDEGLAYGPGLVVEADDALWHSGGGAGHYTEFTVSPDRHTTVTISCNQDGVDIAGVHADLVEVWMDSPTN